MTQSQELKDFLEQIDREERVLEYNTLIGLREIIKSEQGKLLIEYLFNSLSVGEVPPKGLKDEELHDFLGFLRAGNAIYKLVCQADYETASQIMAKIERKKNENAYHIYRIESGLTTNADGRD